MEFKRKGRKEIRNPEASGRKEKPVQMNRFLFLALIVAISFFCFVLRQAQHDKTKKIKRIAGIATNYTLKLK